MSRILRGALSLVLIGAIFFFGLPKIADFSKVWEEIGAMTWLEIGTLCAVALWNIATYWVVMMASLPGSNVWQTMKINQASTAVANTLPGGGAIAIGVTYGMYSNYGFSPSAISLSVIVSGIWNNFVKLGMPVVALTLLVVQGDAGTALVVASGFGLLALALAIGLFAAVLKSDRLALKVGQMIAQVVEAARRIARRPKQTNFAEGTLRFRREAIDLIKRRWLALTLSTVVSHLSLYLVLLLSLRHVGVTGQQVTWVEALAAFAFVRLISALPITPGGLGVVELGLTAALIAADGPRPEVVAAVLVFRALTYLLPIPFGFVAYLKYKQGSQARRERLADQAAKDEEAGVGPPSGVPVAEKSG